MSTTEMRDALVARVISDWEPDGPGYVTALRFLNADLDALIAAAQQEARAGLVADVADIYYRLESALGHLGGAPEQVVQDVYFTYKHAERAAERLGIIGPDLVASVLDVAAQPPAPVSAVEG